MIDKRTSTGEGGKQKRQRRAKFLLFGDRLQITKRCEDKEKLCVRIEQNSTGVGGGHQS